MRLMVSGYRQRVKPPNGPERPIAISQQVTSEGGRNVLEHGRHEVDFGGAAKQA
jgi:hypothetical protein